MDDGIMAADAAIRSHPEMAHTLNLLVAHHGETVFERYYRTLVPPTCAASTPSPRASPRRSSGSWRATGPSPSTRPSRPSSPLPAGGSCIGNETRWPLYSYVAPMSWLVQRDVEDGRRELNFSDWGRDDGVDDMAEVVAEGSMPPRNYRLLHPGARLSEAERAALIRELEALSEAGEDGDRSGSNRGRG